MRLMTLRMRTVQWKLTLLKCFWVLFMPVFLPENSSAGILTINSATGIDMWEADSFFPLHKYLGFFFWDIFAHPSSKGTLDLSKSAHISESDSWEKHGSESNPYIAGKITSLNAKRVWLKGLRKRQMPVIGPNTNLFIVSLSRVKSSPLGSPLRIRPWVSWDLISQRTTGMADGKDLLGHPVHMPQQEQNKIVSLLRSQVLHLDLNNSSNTTVIPRKFHCLHILLQNCFLKSSWRPFVHFAWTPSQKRKVSNVASSTRIGLLTYEWN